MDIVVLNQGFLLRTEAVLKLGFFKVFHPPGLTFETFSFLGQNNSIPIRILKHSGRVYKEPMNIGGMDGTRTRSLRSDSAML
jgi:hypothetical protein